MRAQSRTAGSGFVPVLDGLRGLAILVIVGYHLCGATEWTPNGHLWHGLYEAGFLGVDALCFTTGFVLFLPVIRHGSLGSIRGFALRRFARLAPAYYVCLVLIVLLYPLLSTPAIEAHANFGIGAWAAHLSFLAWPLMPSDTGFIVDQPLWTLSIDVCFYCLLPLIASAYLRRPLLGLALGVAASIVWRLGFQQLHTPPAHQHLLIWLVQMPLFLADFSAGMTSAWLFCRLRERPPQWLGPRILVAVAGISGALLLVLAYLAGANLPYALGAYQEPVAVAALFPLALGAFIVALALGPTIVSRPLTNRPSRRFAQVSYSVYLYHFPVIFFALFTLDIPRNHRFPALMAVAVLPLLLGVTIVSYYGVERPGRRRIRALAAGASDR